MARGYSTKDYHNLADEVQEMVEYLMGKSLWDYASYVELTNEGWIKGRHLNYICQIIQKFLEDDLQTDEGPAKILVISMPPQHGKTLCVTETLPSWFVGRNQNNSCIILSYGKSLALRFGRRNKEKMLEWGSKIFGVQLSKHKKSDEEFEVEKKRGRVLSTSLIGGITGHPADLILIDDPIKNKMEADSETYRERVWGEFMNSVNTRLSALGKIIVIQTRWHEDDLAGRIIDRQIYPTYVVNIPCEAEEDDVLGRKPGDPLFPEIGKDKAWVQMTKNAYAKGTNPDVQDAGSGMRAWNALYQGHPTALEGNMIQRKWWNYWEDLPSQWDECGIFVDCAFKGTDTSDFVVLMAVGKFMNDFYFVDAIRQRLNFPETIKAIKVFRARNPKFKTIMIEDKANGPAVIDTLKNEIVGIIPYTPQGSKESRVSAVTPAIESGHCYVPKYSAWTSEFIEECAAFPNGKNDDYVDVTSMALRRLYLMPGKFRKIRPKEGYYTPMEMEEFNKRNNNFVGDMRRPGKLKGDNNGRKRFIANG